MKRPTFKQPISLALHTLTCSKFENLLFVAAAICVALVNVSVQADTFWSAETPATVSDLLNADNWSNGAPVTADNPGLITGQKITVSNDFYPGAEGQDIDITFNGSTSTTFSKGFVPLKNLPNGKTATFTMRLQDNANVYVTNNFWGGNNDKSQSYDQSGKDYLIYQYYGGDSSFSCNEWWTAMTAKTYIEISDNAVVTARGGSNSGLGWDDTAPFTADGSVLAMNDKGALSVSSTNLNFFGVGTTVNMHDSSTMTAKALYISRGAPQVNLYDNSKITTSDILKLDNSASLTLNDKASLTVAKDCAFDRDGAFNVNDNAVVTFNAALKVGDVNAGSNGGAVFNQTGGKVTVNGTGYFSYHADATVNLSGGQFISNGNELYVTDQKGKTANIAMTNDAYLQAKDLRLSQHGNTNLTMADNSQIKVTNLNMAYNYTAGDNVVNVVTLGDNANITASNNMYFFGRNQGGAAYGSLTLNDNASVNVANNAQIGLGTATNLIDGKSYTAEITLNESSKFSSNKYITTTGATSQTNVNGLAKFNASTIDIASGSEFNINGGSVNVSTLTNTGTVNLTDGAVNLNPYGLITSTDGTFNVAGGAINLNLPSNVAYTNGDQALVGFFANADVANNVSGKIVVPEGWQTAVTTVNGKTAIVANYGTAPAGEMKIWKEDTTGSMADAANWEGDASNPTGYVLGGTNTISGITGKTIVAGGTNTFSGNTPVGATLALSGGTAQYNDAKIEGALIVTDGTFNNSGRMDIGYDQATSDVGAVFNQSGGTVNVTGITFFGYHANATVDLSGGRFIANGNQLYVTDQKNRHANITMSGDAYLQAKDLRLSQHGNTNLTMSGDSSMKVDVFNLAYNCDNGDNVQTYVAMSGNSQLNAASFKAFDGNNSVNHKGAAYASFTMTDNARAVITSTAWGGSNDETNVPGLISGKDYNFEMKFSGNSYFSANEFWMAMAGKIHLTIEDNATVVAGAGAYGLSGLGWCNKTTDSLLEINGGNLLVEANGFYIGRTNNSENTSACYVKQTDGNAIYKNIYLARNASSYEISGDNSVMIANSVATLPGSTFSVAGGTVTVDGINNEGTFAVTDGMLNIGANGITGDASGTIQLAGGTITAGADALAADQRGSWSTDLNAVLTGGKTSDADNRITFAPAADASIAWNGALSGDGGLILDGEGTFALAQAPAYTGATAIEKGTMTLAQGGTLYNLTGGSVNDDGSVAVAAAIDASGQELTIDNAVMTKFVGSIKAQSILKTGYGTLKIYADEDNKVVADTFTVSESELDFKGYYEGDLEVINGAFYSPGNSIGEANITGNIAFITDTADSNGFAYFEFGDFTGADENHDLLVLSASSLFNANDEAGVVLLDFANDDAADWASAGVDYLLVKNGAFEDGKDYTSWLTPTLTDLFSLQGKADGLYLIGLAAPPEPGSGVPEPSTWGLLALGVAGLLYWRKRK